MEVLDPERRQAVELQESRFSFCQVSDGQDPIQSCPEGAQESQLFFRDSLPIAQKWSVLIAESTVESRLNSNTNKNYLESENEEGLSRRITWACSGGIRKNKDWLQSKLEMDIKCKSKAMYSYISSIILRKMLTWYLLLSGLGNSEKGQKTFPHLPDIHDC